MRGGKLHCLKCEATWLGSVTSRCLCGAEGASGPLPDAPTPSGMGMTVTNFASLPDPDEPDHWSLW